MVISAVQFNFLFHVDLCHRVVYEKSKKLVDTNLLSVAVVSKHTAVRLKVGSMADSNSGGSSNNHNHQVSSI